MDNDMFTNESQKNGKCKKKTEEFNAGVRNPLSDIAQNIDDSRRNLNSYSLKKSFNYSSKIETCSNGVLTTDNIVFEHRHIEKEANNEVFVGLATHKEQTTKAQRSDIENKSQVRALPLLNFENPASQRERKPVHKIRLIRKLSNRLGKNTPLEDMFKNCLYDKEYFKNNYIYMVEREKRYVYSRPGLENMDVSHRPTVINWLIYAHQVLNLNEATLFMAVRMFDYVIMATKIKNSRYCLVALVCLWIANKTIDVQFIETPKLTALSNGKFCQQDINTMEREILKLLKYDTNFAEPTSFLFYYLRLFKLDLKMEIVYSCLFILETSTLLLEFSTLRPSFLVVCSIYMVCEKLQMDTTNLLKFIHKNILQEETFSYQSKQLIDSIKKLLLNKTLCEEVVDKYKAKERNGVALNFVFF